LIGYPVKHSYSAFMHNAAFAYYHMDAQYRLFEVPPEDLEEFLTKTIFEQNIRGFNVTIPHKERVFAHFTDSHKMSYFVKCVQSVNTVRVEPDGSLFAYNTDGPGFISDLKERKVDISGKKVSVIGAGGGARAVAMMLASERPQKLLIFDIDKEKAFQLVQRIKEFHPDSGAQRVDSISRLEIKDADILVNATPVGMKPSDPLIVQREWLRPGLFVYDLIYNPPETKLLKTAADAGCRVANGLGMLLIQGCLAFEKWTGQKAPTEIMRKALFERIDV